MHWFGFAPGLVVSLSLCAAVAHAQQSPPPSGSYTENLLTPPSPSRIFRLESEPMLKERMARDARDGDNPVNLRYEIVFPSYPAVPPPVALFRGWPAQPEVVEPPYVCYHRLLFEQINAERYGWDLGPLHPILSAGVFYWDVATLPYHLAEEPLRRFESNAGYCLPGDPVPLLLYPPRLSLSGSLAEGAAIGMMFVIFP
jgi:hypothetical protein